MPLYTHCCTHSLAAPKWLLKLSTALQFSYVFFAPCLWNLSHTFSNLLELWESTVFSGFVPVISLNSGMPAMTWAACLLPRLGHSQGKLTGFLYQCRAVLNCEVLLNMFPPQPRAPAWKPCALCSVLENPGASWGSRVGLLRVDASGIALGEAQFLVRILEIPHSMIVAVSASTFLGHVLEAVVSLGTLAALPGSQGGCEPLCSFSGHVEKLFSPGSPGTAVLAWIKAQVLVVLFLPAGHPAPGCCLGTPGSLPHWLCLDAVGRDSARPLETSCPFF